MADNPYIHEWEIVNEDGDSEVWTVHYRRMTIEDWEVFKQAFIDGALDEGDDMTSRDNRLFLRLVKSVSVDGSERPVKQFPLEEVGVAVYRHPRFRRVYLQSVMGDRSDDGGDGQESS